jgi:hypothetical protein
MVNEGLRVCGLDIHPPTNFSPVPGLRYLNQPLDSDSIQMNASAAWPMIEDSDAMVVLFNGIWSADLALREKLLYLAKSRNVFLSDEFDVASLQILRDRNIVAQVVTAIPHPTRPDWISVSLGPIAQG